MPRGLSPALTMLKYWVIQLGNVLGQWLNWQSSGLQNHRLGVRVPPDLPLFGKFLR